MHKAMTIEKCSFKNSNDNKVAAFAAIIRPLHKINPTQEKLSTRTKSHTDSVVFHILVMLRVCCVSLAQKPSGYTLPEMISRTMNALGITA